ncbi:S-adenosylmethionine mitochondrial carrier protein [Cyphellophora attinorum]|uniref:S-adenosylmethionine mitochondrial carrier protein n=1 Tax=Cyphellophora attinorum TaxID=1664694 RepID=A0A0N1HHS0_9EURO|nr:S-adenosylmethionine mitochondrial carrier protein [Phialophora attinorum]KPI45637.1 S-adenosylmethionine mitochondrial carrier protein [Phialophora attinorum]
MSIRRKTPPFRNPTLHLHVTFKYSNVRLTQDFSVPLLAIIGIRLWLSDHGFAVIQLQASYRKVTTQTDRLRGSISSEGSMLACEEQWTITGNLTDASGKQIQKSKLQSTELHLSSAPYDNYFYSDCNVAAQMILTSPSAGNDLQVIGPRVIVAWPAGNSGACLFFKPENGVNGTLAIKLVNSTIGSPLGPVYIEGDDIPYVGIEGVLHLNSTAVVSLSILGSIRAIRDFTEGPSLLHPVLQEGIQIKTLGDDGVSISRLWLDNSTTTTTTLRPHGSGSILVDANKIVLEAGEYLLSAFYNYPQLNQLDLGEVLRDKDLVEQRPHEAKALSFLSYSEKILAGAWRFLTYFGRDDMISTLILLPALTNEAIEAVIGSVLERINRADGSACHEETIGDYATYMNLQDGHASTAYRCDYSMVDTDYFVPILMHAYFVESGAGMERLEALLATPAGSVDPDNKGLSWGDLFILLVTKIMRETAPFAAPGGQTRENLIHLKDGHETGVWRDSVYGIGGGRIPFDVNVALAPSALRSIESLARVFGTRIFGEYEREWTMLAAQYAQVWEDKTLEFFKVVVPQSTARERLETFVSTSSFYDGPSHAELIDADVSYHALALQGNNGLDVVPVMNTDACCRIFYLNGTNQARLTNYLNATALSILRPFPAGLMTSVGLVVANPAFSENEVVRQNFTNSAYHGTVVWSWQLVAMVRGLERQLGRCSVKDDLHLKPDFCHDSVVYGNVRDAYNRLWDVLEESEDFLTDEAGAFAGFSINLLVFPLDTLKTRVQSPAYREVFRSTAAISNRSLFRGLYQGVGTVALIAVPSSGVFFTTYEGLKYALNDTWLSGPVVHATSSGVAQLLTSAVVAPAEVIKQNAQMLAHETRRSSGVSPTLGALRQLLEHPAALWRGYTALAARDLPFAVLQFPAYEQIKARLTAWRSRFDEGRSASAATLERAQISAVSAGIAGCAAAWATTPFDVVKTRMMLEAGAGNETSIHAPETNSFGKGGMSRRSGFETGALILRHEGVTGLFRGGLVRAVLTIVGNGLYMGFYEGARSYLAG